MRTRTGKQAASIKLGGTTAGLCRAFYKRLSRGARPIRRGSFARSDDGAAAVEFALVVLPFLALLFAILQTALIFFATQTLDAAVASAGRLIRTGQAQTANYSAANFKTAVCARIVAIFNCSGSMYVNVKTYSSFSGTSVTPPYNGSGQLDTTAMNYTPGGAGSIVVVQLYYQMPIYMSLLNSAMSNQTGNNRLLVSTAVFQNEPYQ